MKLLKIFIEGAILQKNKIKLQITLLKNAISQRIAQLHPVGVESRLCLRCSLRLLDASVKIKLINAGASCTKSCCTPSPILHYPGLNGNEFTKLFPGNRAEVSPWQLIPRPQVKWPSPRQSFHWRERERERESRGSNWNQPIKSDKWPGRSSVPADFMPVGCLLGEHSGFEERKKKFLPEIIFHPIVSEDVEWGAPPCGDGMQ